MVSSTLRRQIYQFSDYDGQTIRIRVFRIASFTVLKRHRPRNGLSLKISALPFCLPLATSACLLSSLSLRSCPLIASSRKPTQYRDREKNEPNDSKSEHGCQGGQPPVISSHRGKQLCCGNWKCTREDHQNSSKNSEDKTRYHQGKSNRPPKGEQSASNRRNHRHDVGRFFACKRHRRH